MSTFLPWISLALASIALFLGVYAVRVTKIKSVRAISLRRMMKLETEMLEFADSLASIRKSLHVVRSRINMRNLRASRANGVDEEPDSIRDPDAWRAWARRKHLNKE